MGYKALNATNTGGAKPRFLVYPQSLRDSSQEHGKSIPRHPFGRYAPSYFTAFLHRENNRPLFIQQLR